MALGEKKAVRSAVRSAVRRRVAVLPCGAPCGTPCGALLPCGTPCGAVLPCCRVARAVRRRAAASAVWAAPCGAVRRYVPCGQRDPLAQLGSNKHKDIQNMKVTGTAG